MKVSVITISYNEDVYKRQGNGEAHPMRREIPLEKS